MTQKEHVNKIVDQPRHDNCNSDYSYAITI